MRREYDSGVSFINRLMRFGQLGRRRERPLPVDGGIFLLLVEEIGEVGEGVEMYPSP